MLWKMLLQLTHCSECFNSRLIQVILLPNSQIIIKMLLWVAYMLHNFLILPDIPLCFGCYSSTKYGFHLQIQPSFFCSRNAVCCCVAEVKWKWRHCSQILIENLKNESKKFCRRITGLEEIWASGRGNFWGFIGIFGGLIIKDFDTNKFWDQIIFFNFLYFQEIQPCPLISGSTVSSMNLLRTL